MSKITRHIWCTTYAALVKWRSRSQWFLPAGKAREFFTRRVCAEVGERIAVERNPTFSSKVHMDSYARIGCTCELKGGLHSDDRISMAPEVAFRIANHEYGRLDVPMNVQGGASTSPVCVGSDVRPGRREIVMLCAHIGDGHMIMTGAVACKDVPAFSIAGAPARVIGSRREV